MTTCRPKASKVATAPYLVISRIGAGSLHKEWLPNDGSFDVLLSRYDLEAEAKSDEHILTEYRPGPKVAGYGQIIREYESLIHQYRYVALFDDDLATDAASILRVFQAAERNQLKIAQPALDHQSYFTYACLLKHKGFILRHVNFVEMMCPFFRSDVLLHIAPLFELGFESGIDLVWSALVQRSRQDFAVIDSVPVHHARPVGEAKTVNGFVDGRIYETDIHAILERFGLPWLPVLPYGGLRRNGKYSASRLVLGLEAMRLVKAVPVRSVRFRVGAIARYWKHLAKSRPREREAAISCRERLLQSP